MYLAVMVGKFVKQVVRGWCPSPTRPLLPSMTDSLLAPGREVLYKGYRHVQGLCLLLQQLCHVQGLYLLLRQLCCLCPCVPLLLLPSLFPCRPVLFAPFLAVSVLVTPLAALPMLCVSWTWPNPLTSLQCPLRYASGSSGSRAAPSPLGNPTSWLYRQYPPTAPGYTPPPPPW